MLRHFEEKNDPSCLKSLLSDLNWPPSSLLFKVVPPSFERGPVLLANLIRGGEWVTSAMDMPFKPKHGTVSQVFNICNWLSYFYQWYPPFDSFRLNSKSLTPFSEHSLFLTFLSEISPLPMSIFFLRRLGLFVLFLSIPFLGFTQTLNRSVAVLLRCFVFSFLVTILQLASRIRGRRPFFYDFL